MINMTSDNDKKVFEKVTENWNIFTGLIEKKIQDATVRDTLLELCTDIEDRLAVCPASTRVEFVGACPGGLIAHSLNVLKIMKDLNKTYNANLSPNNLIITALFHDIGKIGTPDEDYYLVQESNWHRDRGMLYEINSKIPMVPVSIRSIWWLYSTGVPLSEHEIHAISSLQHVGQMYSQELYNSPMLTLILQQAVRGACVIGKGKKSVLDF
jgi:hypothetical protein